jgi:hypothetical protein
MTVTQTGSTANTRRRHRRRDDVVRLGSARSQHSQGRRSQPGKKRSTDNGPPKPTSFTTDRHRPADRSVTDAPLYCLNPVLVPVGFTRCAPPLKTAEA